ncbi:uncharacterized protein UDID_07531 [Ustilago sp. UG-2017a]|nr:uncharacterized protein UDID_07531 [Ustilago sp. UG-2017a]
MYDQGSTSRGTFHNLQETRLSTAPDSYDTDPNQHATHQPPESLESLEAEALEVLGQRKRRKRIRLSCAECHRRKSKCNRQTPCSKCVERGVADACVPHDGSAQDVHDRMRRLEALLSRFVRASRNDPRRSCFDRPQQLPTSSNAFAPDTHEHAGTQSGLSPHNNAASSASTPSSRRNGSSTPRRKSNPGIITAASLPFRAQVGSEMLEFSSSTQNYPPSAHFERLVREGSLQRDEIRNLASALPSQQETSTLLDIFFRDINPLMFPLDEMWFRDAVNSAVDVIWADADVSYAQDGPNHLSVISLLFSLLALTFSSLPRQYGSEASVAAEAVRMSHQSHKCNMLAASLQCHDLFIVFSHLLLARFLILQRLGRESWLVLGCAVREAQMLGLHRLGAALPEHQHESTESQMRRIAWMHLYYEDRISSLIVGQAPLIHDSYCDTEPPAAPTSRRADSALLDLPSVLRVRHDLSAIVNKVLDLFFSDQHDMTYEATLQLDNELQAFKAALPRPYQMDDEPLLQSLATTDKVLHRNISLQRFLMHVSIFYVLISIHLPYLRRGNDESGFERSRKAALEAAIGECRARRRLRKEVDWSDHFSRDVFVGGRFFYFHATSTMGLCLLSETDRSKAQQLLPFLDEFLETAQEHQRQQSVDPNRCIRQEISIVSLIRGRVRRKFGLCDVDAAFQSSQGPCPNATTMHIQSSTVNDVAIAQSSRSAHNAVLVESQAHLVGSDTPSRYSPPASALRSELMQTRQPEVGEDAYEWWTWLVASMSPSDLLSTMTPGGMAGSTDAQPE